MNVQMSAFRGEAKMFCSIRALPVMTLTGRRSIQNFSPLLQDAAGAF
jgi:hypothetical protein